MAFRVSGREVEVHRLTAIALFSMAMIVGCHQTQRGDTVFTPDETKVCIAELRAAYAAFNRSDIDSAVRFLDPHVEWIEPAEFPGRGTYYGVEGAKQYLVQSRAGAAHVISTPEKFIPAGDRIVVFVVARVLPKGSDIWQEVRLADVYTFHKGRVTKMRAFANRGDALHWVHRDQP